jgi:hypothetical protein
MTEVEKTLKSISVNYKLIAVFLQQQINQTQRITTLCIGGSMGSCLSLFATGNVF